jgi:hypothetical protein
MNQNSPMIPVERRSEEVDYKTILSHTVEGLKKHGDTLNYGFCLQLRNSIWNLHQNQADPSTLITELKSLKLRYEPRNPAAWQAVGRKLLQSYELEFDTTWDAFTGLLLHATRPNTDMAMNKLERFVENLASRLTSKSTLPQLTELGNSHSEVTELPKKSTENSETTLTS